tara:strand:+ start:395 stop:919 length:525 start_codon:yes stop_codon:yes gene_type:complete
MSSSNAAAIRRRVTAPQQTTLPKPPPAPVQTQVREKQTGLTMQQFISTLDKRVVSLESAINKTVQDSTEPTVTDVLDEFQTRFEMIATEMADIKDAMLKLQTYTMDVNKMLLDERIQILSDVNPNSTARTVGYDTDLNSVVSIGANTINTEHTSVDMRELVQEEINKKNEKETV